jgi:hypothetical protein
LTSKALAALIAFLAHLQPQEAVLVEVALLLELVGLVALEVEVALFRQ